MSSYRSDLPSGCRAGCPWAFEKLSIDLLWGKWCLSVYFASFHQIFYMLAENQNRHKSLNVFEIRPDRTSNCKVSCSWVSEIVWRKCCQHSSSYIYHWILFIHAGNEDNQNNSDDFKIRQDPSRDCWFICPWASEKILIDIKWEKSCQHCSAFIFIWSVFLQVNTTAIRSWISSKFSKPFSVWNNSRKLIMGEMLLLHFWIVLHHSCRY